jgi:hypothetical protein
MDYTDAPPPRSYRHRKAFRGKAKHKRRAHRGPQPGYVTR